MTWKPIDFQGIVTLDKIVIDQLQSFLESKESSLSLHILDIVHQSPIDLQPPLDPPAMKLSDAIEATNKKVRQLVLAKNGTPIEWKQINPVLWNYVEVLENSATELFQQIDQIGVEYWEARLLNVIDEIKVMLIHKIDDLIWAIKRLETIIAEHLKLTQTGWKTSWRANLEPSIIDNLDKTKKFLGFRYQKFASRFHQFLDLKKEVDEKTQTISSYHVLNVLDMSDRDLYYRFFTYLHIWEKNVWTRALPNDEIVYAIRRTCSFQKAYHVFKDYYAMLRMVMFERSRNLKNNPHEVFLDNVGKKILAEVLDGFKAETKDLSELVTTYRKFLLENDPNAKTRKFWKVSSWLKKHEPHEPHQLSFLIEDINFLAGLFEKLKFAVEKGPLLEEKIHAEKNMEDIKDALHEMVQPLATKSSLKEYSQKVVNGIKNLNELGTYYQGSVEFIGESLSKVLRADWKYQTLYDIPDFYDVYGIHQGIAYYAEDRIHTNRLNKFKRILQELDHWHKALTFPKHVHDIELDASDIKGYLQDFLGQVQRFAREPMSPGKEYREQLNEYYRQLLEYRYLFGSFFHELHQEEMEERNLRNQFLFVDQYFESIDSKLSEIKLRVPTSE